MQLIPRLASLLRTFHRDRSGVSAVEFALLAPLMVLLYCGMTELTQGYLAKRRADHVSATLGDLTAQVSSINQANISDVFKAAALIMAPYPATDANLSMRLTSVVSDPTTGSLKVVWNATQGSGTGWRTLSQIQSDITDPTTKTVTMIGKGDGVIVAEAKYQYSPFTKYFISTPVTFSNVFYLRPRRSSAVACTDCPPPS